MYKSVKLFFLFLQEVNKEVDSHNYFDYDLILNAQDFLLNNTKKTKNLRFLILINKFYHNHPLVFFVIIFLNSF